DLVLISELATDTAAFAVSISREFDIPFARILMIEPADSKGAVQSMDPRLWRIARPLNVGDLHVTLAAAIAAPAAAVDSPAERTYRDGLDGAGARVVLIADDNHANILVAQAMVERLGYATLTVNDGQQALDAVQSRDIALLLLDCYMPGMDGFAATQAIRRLRGPQRHLPIVAMTARVGSEDRQRCTAAGMDDILIKPLSIDALAHVFNKLLDAPSPATLTAVDTAPMQNAPALHSIDMAVLQRLRDQIGDQRLGLLVRAVLEGMP